MRELAPVVLVHGIEPSTAPGQPRRCPEPLCRAARRFAPPPPSHPCGEPTSADQPRAAIASRRANRPGVASRLGCHQTSPTSSAPVHVGTPRAGLAVSRQDASTSSLDRPCLCVGSPRLQATALPSRPASRPPSLCRVATENRLHHSALLSFAAAPFRVAAEAVAPKPPRFCCGHPEPPSRELAPATLSRRGEPLSYVPVSSSGTSCLMC